MKTITKLARSNNRKNRTRSGLILLSVFLTTVLLSAIATFGYGQIRYQKVNAKNFYGSYYGTYAKITADQIEEMKKQREFDRIGIAAVAGDMQSAEGISVSWADEETIRLTNLKKQMEEGDLPQKEKEIAGQRGMFKKLGYPKVKVGDTVSLPFRRDETETYEKREFVVSGILKSTGEEEEDQSYMAYVSASFYEGLYPPQQRIYNVYFTLDDSESVTSSSLEHTIKELGKRCGINPEYAAENGYYALWVLDPGRETIIGCTVVALVVMFFAVLVIYNIFQVGLVQKIQEYGKIRALGATRKQMKKLVFREGMMLALPAIPAGLAVGTTLSVLLMKLWLSKSRVFGDDAIPVNMVSIPLLLLCGAAGILTVFMALRRPIRMISRISPMEAIRFQKEDKKGRKPRKGRKQMDVNGLTKANLSMHGSRTVGTILSMGLSCVLFVVIANFTGNVSPVYDARKTVPYGQFQIELNYSTSDKAYPENNLDAILKNNPLDKKFLNRIKRLDGVTDVQTQHIAYIRDSKGEIQSVGILNRKQFEDEAYQGALEGEVDYDQAVKEGEIFYGWSRFIDESGYSLGDVVSLPLYNADEETKFQGTFKGAFGSSNYTWILTDQTYEKLPLSGKSIGVVWVDCKKKDCKKVEKELEKLLADKKHCQMNSFEKAMETSKESLSMFETMAYGFLCMVGLIAFMNMANTMIISVITRKRELGILQALGMTSRQMSRMLRNEGLIFTLGSIAISLLVGMPAGYALFGYGRKNAYFGLDVYHVPLLEIGVMIGILLFLQISLSYVLSRNVKKESVVERIRNEE